MLEITITPTMLTFKNLTDEMANKLHDAHNLKWSDKGYYYIQGNEKELFKTLLSLAYTYDIELS